MMKKMISLILIVSFILCACGKEETASSVPLVPADEYEVEWVDTSALTPGDGVAACVVDSRIYFIQMIWESADEDNRIKYRYEEVFYDMVSGEWSEPKVIPATDKINQMGMGYAFEMASDGTWYFQCCDWDEKEKRYYESGVARLTEDGFEKIEVPEDIAKEKLIISQYTVRNNGKLYFKVYPESKEEEGFSPEDLNVVIYDPVTEEFEYCGDLLIGETDFIIIEDEFFYYSIAGGGSGFSVKTKETGDVVQRELFCEGEVPEGGWESEEIHTIHKSCDEEDNVYIFNAGGIYGGYYKDTGLKNIVPASIIGELNLTTIHDRDKSNYMADFWRGAETDYADFYVLVADTSDEIYDKLTLAHIKKKEQ